MSRKRLRVFVATGLALGMLAAVIGVALASRPGAATRLHPKAIGSEPGAGTALARPGRGGEGTTAEDYRVAARAYPADQLQVAWSQSARTTFEKIAARTPRPKVSGPNPGLLNVWQNYGPQQHATEPGFLNFSGANYNTASRTASIAISPFCGSGIGPYPCRMWVGPVGGGVWRTDDATAAVPAWTPVGQSALAQNSIGNLALDPNDITGNTIYAGTGEPSQCSSGCEAGVG